VRTARSTSVGRLMAVTVLWSSLVVGCGDYSITLPGNYEISRIYGGTYLISGPSRENAHYSVIVVPATVDGYQIYGTLVVGHVSVADLEPDKSLSQPG
jgi:hypothetical protein